MPIVALVQMSKNWGQKRAQSFFAPFAFAG
jgi:hypothetical protein